MSSRIVVVLPEPDGPMMPRIVPAANGQGDPVDRHVVPESLRDTVDDDGRLGIGQRVGGRRRIRTSQAVHPTLGVSSGSSAAGLSRPAGLGSRRSSPTGAAG